MSFGEKRQVTVNGRRVPGVTGTLRVYRAYSKNNKKVSKVAKGAEAHSGRIWSVGDLVGHCENFSYLPVTQEGAPRLNDQTNLFSTSLGGGWGGKGRGKEESQLGGSGKNARQQ